MAKLKDLAEQGGWFSDVLADTDIFLGIRNNVLDAYWHGCRLFHVTRKGKAGPLKVATHPKYLIDPGLGGEIVLTDINFGLGEHAAFIESYEGTTTLARMKRAAKLYALPEKDGVHSIISRNPRNPNVIDLEIAFRQQNQNSELDDESKLRKIDIASLEEAQDEIHLRFWEAKCYANQELFAADGDAKVVGQIEGYRQLLKLHWKQVCESYTNIAVNLVEFSRWTKANRKVGCLTEKVAQGQRLSDGEPIVGLVIFDFDDDQRKGERFRNHITQKLSTRIRPLIPRGNASNIQLIVREGTQPAEHLILVKA